jgi:pyrroloquinoline quinone (PQQ) biosynthesis protein C
MTMTTEKPFLRRNARVSQLEDCVVIQYLQDEITLHGSAAQLFGKLVVHLDGKSAVEHIAAEVREEPRRVALLLEQLNRSGVVTLLAGTGEDPTAISGAAFYQMHRKYCENWLRPVYDHPLWEKITSGRASRAQVLGFAFEKYHYIEGAYEHMSIAAANATPEMMPHLARHFIEEYTHGDIYRVGLRSLFRDEVILASQPLPSTRALINFLSESAARSSFSYYAGNELLQMTENTGEASASGAVNDFYGAMRTHYPYTAKVIDSFIAHTHADQKLGHESVFEEMCKSVPPLSRAQVNDALETVRSMAEHLLLFMDGIDVAYERLCSVPRLACSLSSE